MQFPAVKAGVKSIREALVPLKIAFLINMPHSNLTNINQMNLTNFRCAQSVLRTPNIPWSNLSGEQSCFHVLNTDKWDQLHTDVILNATSFRAPLTIPLEKDPLVAACNHQMMLLSQLATCRQHRDLQHIPDKQRMAGWLHIPSVVTSADQTLPGNQHITWLCLIPLVCLTAAGASHSSFPENSAPHMVRVNFLHAQHPHTTPDPGEDTGPSPGGALLSKHGQADERKKRERWKSAQTYKTKFVWLKTAERCALPQLQGVRAVALMQGHCLRQLHWSCMAKSRERFSCSEHLPFPAGTRGYETLPKPDRF